MDYVHRTNLIPDPRFQHFESMVAKDVTVQPVNHENGRRSGVDARQRPVVDPPRAYAPDALLTGPVSEGRRA